MIPIYTRTIPACVECLDTRKQYKHTFIYIYVEYTPLINQWNYNNWQIWPMANNTQILVRVVGILHSEQHFHTDSRTLI